jgi:hypothetical protein
MVCGAQQFSWRDVVQRSEKYYSTKAEGKLTIRGTFKSSIAESFIYDDLEIIFCKPSKKFNIISGGYSSYLAGSKYYYFDISGKKYMNLSANKAFKEEKRNYLKQYPQFDENYFTRFQNGKFKLEMKEGFIHIFDLQEHFYFDSTNYSIVKYENFSYSATGLQIKKWEIVDQLYFANCNLLFDKKLPHGFVKVKSFEAIRTKEKITGEKFSALSGKVLWKLDDGSNLVSTSAEGQFILLDFFYQSCMPCIKSFEEIKSLYSSVKEGKLKIIGVDPVVADSATMIKFKARYKLTHPVLSGTEAARLDKIFNPTAIYPYYIIINPQGIVVKTIEGYNSELAQTILSSMK